MLTFSDASRFITDHEYVPGSRRFRSGMTGVLRTAVMVHGPEEPDYLLLLCEEGEDERIFFVRDARSIAAWERAVSWAEGWILGTGDFDPLGMFTEVLPS